MPENFVSFEYITYSKYANLIIQIIAIWRV